MSTLFLQFVMHVANAIECSPNLVKLMFAGVEPRHFSWFAICGL